MSTFITGREFKELCASKNINISYANIKDTSKATLFEFVVNNISRNYIDIDDYDYDNLMHDLVMICKLIDGTFDELKTHFKN